MTTAAVSTGVQPAINSTSVEAPQTGSMANGREVAPATASATVTKTKQVKRKHEDDIASQELSPPPAPKRLDIASLSSSSAISSVATAITTSSTAAVTTPSAPVITAPIAPTITLSTLLTTCKGTVSSLSKTEQTQVEAFLADLTTLTLTQSQFSVDLLPLLTKHATKLVALHLPQQVALTKTDLEVIKALPLTSITLSVATDEALAFLQTFPLTSLNVRLSNTEAFTSFPQRTLTELTVSGLLTDPVLKKFESYTSLTKLHLNPNADDNGLQKFSNEALAGVLNTCTQIKDFALSLDTTSSATCTYKVFDLVTSELKIESMTTSVDVLALATAGPFGYKVTQKLPHVKKLTISAKRLPVFSTNELEQRQFIEFGMSALIATLIAYKHLMKDFSQLSISAPGFTDETLTFDEMVARVHIDNVLDTLKARLQQYHVNLDNVHNMNFFLRKAFNLAVKAAAAYYGFPNPSELGIDLTEIPAYKQKAEQNIPDFVRQVTLLRRSV